MANKERIDRKVLGTFIKEKYSSKHDQLKSEELKKMQEALKLLNDFKAMGLVKTPSYDLAVNGQISSTRAS